MRQYDSQPLDFAIAHCWERADHCNAVAEREERDLKIRAAAREKYL